MKPRSQVRSTPPARRGVRVRIAGGPYAVVTQGDLCVVFWGTIPLYPLRTGDRVGRYLAAIGLVRLHGLSVMAVAKALRIGRRTMYRLMDRFDSSGVDGLYPGWGSRKPTKIRGAAARRLLELKRQGVSNREAARRLGVSPSGVAHALRRLGWKEPPIEPAHVPPEKSDGLAQGQAGPSVPAVVNEEAQAAEPGAAPAREDVGSPAPSSPVEASKPVTADVDPTYRAGDRLMARLGLLEDAAPLFLAGPAVPRAGVLLALPALIGSGIFDVAAKVYGTLGPSFYGLRTSVLALLLMALLRIKRPENLKEVPPAELGRILGLDRGPEVKTLRRKLEDLSDKGKSVEFLDELAKLRAAKHADCLCYLYIDGHVRVYNGDAKLAKTYVTQRRLALPGTTDYWVNDRDGQPLLVVTAEANEGLAKMLLAVLQKTRPLIGDRRPVVAFDRGGWSPKLFQAIINDGWDILTYRKGKTTDVSRRAFRKHTITIDGREVSYTLAERRVRFLGGKLKLRQITKLGENDHQTHILTSKSKAPAAELAYRMFGRWRQENYFKYMRTEFALDALVENGVEQGDPNRSVPNPERKAIEKKLAAAKAALAKLERKYGAAAFDNKEGICSTMRGFKIANGREIGKPLREAREKVEAMQAERASIPARVSVTEALKGKAPIRLRTEMKRLADTLKMVAYQAESALVDLVRPHYWRTDDEGRTLIASALQSAADISLKDGELAVTLARQSSEHRSRAIRAVCDELNKLGVSFPGTDLRLRFGVHAADCANE